MAEVGKHHEATANEVSRTDSPASDVPGGDISYSPFKKHVTPNWQQVGFGPLKFYLFLPTMRAYGQYLAEIRQLTMLAQKQRTFIYALDPNGEFHSAERRFNPVWLMLKYGDVRVFRGPRWLDRIAWVLVRKYRKYVGPFCRRLLSYQDRHLDAFKTPYGRNKLPRRAFAQTVTATFPRDILREVKAIASRYGISANSRIITLHVKEHGYDSIKYPECQSDRRLLLNDRRSSSVRPYVDLCKKLIQCGFTVVRVGDQTMTPIDIDGLIDLATQSNEHAALDLYLISQSEFMIASDSGAYFAAVMLGVPAVRTNTIHPVVNFPVQQCDIYSLKTVFDRDRKVTLSLNDCLSSEFLADFESPDHFERFEFIDHTVEELQLSVDEMLRQLSDGVCETDAQREWCGRVQSAGDALRGTCGYLDVNAADRGFLGRGRIAQWCLERG